MEIESANTVYTQLNKYFKEIDLKKMSFGLPSTDESFEK